MTVISLTPPLPSKEGQAGPTADQMDTLRHIARCEREIARGHYSLTVGVSDLVDAGYVRMERGEHLDMSAADPYAQFYYPTLTEAGRTVVRLFKGHCPQCDGCLGSDAVYVGARGWVITWTCAACDYRKVI